MLRLVLVIHTVTFANAAEWAVLVAGSNGFGNYRHQADVAHAFQIAKKHGIPETNIITMMFDDVARNPENPVKGKLFNKPTPKGVPGIDVYDGIKIDYKGKSVTPQNFIKVLTGDATALSEHGAGKVLKSTAEDNVFVNFVDHGGTGLIAFPDGILHAKELNAALKKMHASKMFKKLVFYLEACESGSMFQGLLPKDIDVYATTAANATESSWGTYCGGNESKVDGIDIGSCLGDLYSVNWMQDTDANPTMAETLLKQFVSVQAATVPPKKPTSGKPGGSHVMQYGDLSIDSAAIGAFQGSKPSVQTLFGEPSVHASKVSSRENDLYYFQRKYDRAETAEEKAAAGILVRQEIQQRNSASQSFRALATLAYPGDVRKQELAMTALDSQPVQPDCELAIHNAMAECSAFAARSGYALQFQRVAVNLCADETLGWQQDTATAAKMAGQACASAAASDVIV